MAVKTIVKSVSDSVQLRKEFDFLRERCAQPAVSQFWERAEDMFAVQGASLSCQSDVALTSQIRGSGGAWGGPAFLRWMLGWSLESTLGDHIDSRHMGGQQMEELLWKNHRTHLTALPWQHGANSTNICGWFHAAVSDWRELGGDDSSQCLLTSTLICRMMLYLLCGCRQSFCSWVFI